MMTHVEASQDSTPSTPPSTPQKIPSKGWLHAFRDTFDALAQRTGLSGGTLSHNLSRSDSSSNGGSRDTPEVWETLETSLLQSDVGWPATEAILEGLQTRVRSAKSAAQSSVFWQNAFLEIVRPWFSEAASSSNTRQFDEQTPVATLLIGANGVGKTTLLAKLAHYWQQQYPQQVLIAAADTYRAAADAQLAEWAERSHTPMVSLGMGKDPAAVVYQAAQKSREAGGQRLLIDTAGRLNNKQTLMDELSKIYRSLEKQWQGYGTIQPVLVVDGTAGHHAVEQVKVFDSACPEGVLAITKLDGSTRGGLVLLLGHAVGGARLKWLSTGETLADLAPFEAEAFLTAWANSLFPEKNETNRGTLV
jgi:fused signal recognition particle receptor